MEVGLTLGLENRKGTLKLSLEDCGCYVKDISIKLNGGASWLYQGMVDAYDEKIGSAVENAITKKLKEGILKLDSFLQASLNVTFVDNPVLSNSSIGFDINGYLQQGKIFYTLTHSRICNLQCYAQINLKCLEFRWTKLSLNKMNNPLDTRKMSNLKINGEKLTYINTSIHEDK
ncbi:hypothetical protein EZV62_020709 [Acer yangbiense]|uniref:Lipid-binding serum glycoprotein N-terminal domain-containing protein n=1 Tax=Acer yangbiense TaxID=1000413 RepID=A0A5C7HE75_9ROSI|nr:hypothetical protein EZV62_020709 [Acer yangbiense]